MPPYASCPLIFLKHVLAGKKKLMLKVDLQPNELKKYPEFTVLELYKVFKDDESVM